MKNLVCLAMVITFLIAPRAIYAQEINAQRATLAIIGEAENQKTRGMLAVACAIRNRQTLRGVFGENNPRVLKHKYSNAIYTQAKSAWTKSADAQQCAFIKGADHWENVHDFGAPSWAKGMTKTYEYKDHIFYNSKKGADHGKR